MKEYTDGKKYPNWVVNHLRLIDEDIEHSERLTAKLNGNKKNLINIYKKEKALKKQKEVKKDE